MDLKVDSPIIQTGIRIVDLLILNLLWAVGCIPGDCRRIHHRCLHRHAEMAEHRESTGVFAAFWRAYAQNLKHGIPLTLIFALVAYSI